MVPEEMRNEENTRWALSHRLWLLCFNIDFTIPQCLLRLPRLIKANIAPYISFFNTHTLAETIKLHRSDDQEGSWSRKKKHKIQVTLYTSEMNREREEKYCASIHCAERTRIELKTFTGDGVLLAAEKWRNDLGEMFSLSIWSWLARYM